MLSKFRFAKVIRKSNGRIALLISAGTVLLIFLCTIALAPANKFREFQTMVNEDSGFTKAFDSLYFHPDMQALIKEKAYLESLLKLSQSDSIQLVVNLSDSTVGLSIKGVSIHRTRISEFSRDKFLERLPYLQEIKLLSEPLPVSRNYATIVKEPIVVRQAPRDTLEAATEAWQPDTLIQNPAFVSFLTEQGLQIIFEQDRNDHFRDHWKKFAFYSHLNSRKVLKYIGNFVTFTAQEYQPLITVKIPADELRAIYRALPENTLVVVRL